jgi:hypothetical protein
MYAYVRDTSKCLQCMQVYTCADSTCAGMQTYR